MLYKKDINSKQGLIENVINRLKKKKLLQSTIGPDVTFERYK